MSATDDDDDYRVVEILQVNIHEDRLRTEVLAKLASGAEIWWHIDTGAMRSLAKTFAALNAAPANPAAPRIVPLTVVTAFALDSTAEGNVALALRLTNGEVESYAIPIEDTLRLADRLRQTAERARSTKPPTRQ